MWNKETEHELYLGEENMSYTSSMPDGELLRDICSESKARFASEAPSSS